MAYWAQSPLDREQHMFISPTLGSAIPEDHPIRLLDELLGQVDWSGWEAHYNGSIGQPPIHPRVMASAILYGLKLGIRSSRKLEDACINRLDFMWLLEGRRPDHSTLSGFRKKFRKDLKDLFRQVARLAMNMEMIHLVEVATDGTRVRANSDRRRTATAASLEKQLEELDAQIEQGLAEMDQADARDDELYGASESANHLPPELANKQARRERLEELKRIAEEADAAKRKRVGKKATPTQVPLSDPDSKVLPNKEGGFAPNYTPVVTTDGKNGLIVDADVICDSAEDAMLVPAMERIRETFEKQPQRVLGDGLYGTGHNLAAMEEKQIEIVTPVQPAGPQLGDAASREDPREPVPQEKWAELRISAQTKKLDRCNFIYDEANHCYICPMGKEMPLDSTKMVDRGCGKVKYDVFRCHDCDGCPLRSRCVQSDAKGRTIQRDQHEKVRERAAARMASAECKEQYKRRLWIGETPFAHIKNVLGVRQFLTRSIENVKSEWLWTCTAFNLSKMMTVLHKQRQESQSVPAAG